MTATFAKNAGWREAVPGYWARECWRIQRMTRWHWWHAIDASLGGPGVRGTVPTLTAAVRAVAAYETASTREASVPSEGAASVEPGGGR